MGILQGGLNMSNKNRDYEKYIDLMWTTLDYWKGMAAYHKEEAEYYKGIVKEAVERGAISVVDEDGNTLIDVEEMEDEEDED